jgi:hypothetical protein
MQIRQTFRIGTFLALSVGQFLGISSSQAQSAPSIPKKPYPAGPKLKPHEAAKNQIVVLVGAGDIAGCEDLSGAKATAELIAKIPGTVFAAGDLAYEDGSAANFKDCYNTTWGAFKDRTKPALGNHEYHEPTASAYFQYWGAAAGPAGKGYYSYDLGNWHVVVLNTNCYIKSLGGCAEGSPQETWLKQDLQQHANDCIVAYGHHALYSSGISLKHAVHTELRPLWQDLYAAHADLILAGHEHSYERFAPQDPNGKIDEKNGIHEIVAGTGGRSHDLLGIPMKNSEVRNGNTYGVLKLTLAPDSYTWEFIPAQGKPFNDSGTATCHNHTN